MSFTKADLIKQAMEVLGVIGSAQTVEAEDSAKMTRILNGVILLLSARDIISLRSEAFADAFPDEVFLPLSNILARHAASSYGIAGGDLAGIMQLANEAEDLILSLYPSGRGDQPTVGEYF